jgi:hypothetical protein
MLRIISWTLCLILLAGCSVIHDRKKLEEAVKREEGLDPGAIEIDCPCSFAELPSNDKQGSFSMGTCVFMRDRLGIYVYKGFGGQVDKKVNMDYSEIIGVALFKNMNFRQLQIEGESRVLALELYDQAGVFYDKAVNARVLKFLMGKGAMENQATHRISASSDNIPCIVPVPNFIFTPCL